MKWRDWPIIPVAALIAVALLVDPWGEFPVNDDWQYARVAKQLAETNRFHIDVPIAPSLVGQSVLAMPFIKLFGFSHLLLRLVTFVLGCLGLVVLDRIGAAARLRFWIRTTLGLTLALSPLYAYLSLSFMTEIAALTPALFAVWLWFAPHRADSEAGESALPPPWAALVAATLIGFLFWTRQLTVVVYPALAGATLIGALVQGRLGPALRRLILPTVAFVAAIVGYFAWSRLSGNLRPEFTGPLAGVTHFEAAVWRVQLGAFVLYASLTCLPMLAWFTFRGASRPAWVFGAILIGLVGLMLGETARGVGSPFVRRDLPILGNIIHLSGLGVNTVTDVYHHGARIPRLPPLIWSVAQTLGLAAVLLWIPFGDRLARVVRRPWSRRAELALFGVLLALGNLAAVIQAYKFTLFDRYHLPGFVGLLIACAALIDEAPPPKTSPRRLGFAAALLASAVFTVGGLYDHFGWQEARARLYQTALEKGISPLNLDGGYELNGWFAYGRTGELPLRCRGGACKTRFTWYIPDDSYRIGYHLTPGYRTIARLKPRTLLVRSRALLLMSRD